MIRGRPTRARIAALAARMIEQLGDPAQLGRYAAANAALLAESDPRPRVVFIGDSIFEGWPGLEALAPPGVRFLDRGVAGQTTAQVLLRFQDDALALGPAAVVILAGVNDLRAVFASPAVVGHAALPRIARHISAMADMAEGRGVRVAVCALPPVHASARSRDPAAVRSVNTWLAGFAAERRCGFVDTYAPLLDENGYPDPRLTRDGVHPNSAGYTAMGAALRDGLRAARIWPRGKSRWTVLRNDP